MKTSHVSLPSNVPLRSKLNLQPADGGSERHMVATQSECFGAGEIDSTILERT